MGAEDIDEYPSECYTHIIKCNGPEGSSFSAWAANYYTTVFLYDILCLYVETMATGLWLWGG